MAGLRVNPTKGRMPALQFAPPDVLAIDPDYQRSIEAGASRKLIRDIAVNWNWDLCQPLVAARRAGVVELYIIDGQHRLAAARLRGDIQQLPVVVVEYASAADEAASFVALNQKRRPLAKIDIFKAALASGDTTALAISAAIEAAGLSIASHQNYVSWKPGMIANIGGIERSWKLHGPEITSTALQVLAEAFDGEVLRYAGTVFPGIAAVCAREMQDGENVRDFDPAMLPLFVEIVGDVDQVQWKTDIAAWRIDHPNQRYDAASASVFGAAWDDFLTEFMGEE
ncbi:ParB/RepB/Spo0J family partition protein [Sphingorhabdus sp. 109]|uniref:ParB/RepB/Spo0J family partition protein n=1 Tax=Sphingorhabdus sp. 109 TaxID=2653173 RepID=UPI0012F021CD|nr:ParB/RepB/Spo0J family partition protein [Sphingorhabdus sp. 109]VWX56699.1 ParB-like nuclease family protein [Sphingorhabdus sp. 109]